jgi:hypothetical protein
MPKMNPQKLVGTLLILLAIAAIGITIATVTLTQITVIPNYATLKAVGVAFYWYKNATGPVTNITWGLVNPDSNNTKLLYCKNIKNSNVTLTLAVGGWIPTNANLYMNAGWNYSGAVLPPQTIMPIEFELNVLSNVTTSGITNFSFNLTVTAIGH